MNTYGKHVNHEKSPFVIENLPIVSKKYQNGIPTNSFFYEEITHIASFYTLQVIVKTMTGKEYLIKVRPFDTITDIKNMICLATATTGHPGVHPAMQHLIFAGKQLEDSRTISSYNIKEGSVMHMVLILRGGMFHHSSNGHVHAQTYNVCVMVDEACFQLEVESSDTISNIKVRVQEALPFSTGACMLFFDKENLHKNTELEDAYALADYNLREGSVLRLVPSCIGCPI